MFAGFTEFEASVNGGVKIYGKLGGEGTKPLLLLHGFAHPTRHQLPHI